MDKFLFSGFPPHKKGRMSFLADIEKSDYPVVIFESKFRIMKLLDELGGLGGSKRIRLVVGREITKIYEEIVRGSIGQIKKHFENDKQKIAGEFAVVIYKEK
jgi:16S rRNA (cytidine1402-2'-O)-methyltransferase